MGIFAWLKNAPVKVVESKTDKPRVVERLALGSVVVDLRKLPVTDVLSGAAFELVRTELAQLGPPSLLLVWTIPVAAFTLPAHVSPFIKGILEFCAIKTATGTPAHQSGVLAGDGPGIAALAFLLRSSGMSVFAIEADGAPPIVEVLTSTGQIVRGMRESALYKG